MTAGRHATVAQHAEWLPRNAFQRRACGIGSKGFRVYDWALIDAAEEHHHFLVRRSIDDGELAYFHLGQTGMKALGGAGRIRIGEIFCRSPAVLRSEGEPISVEDT